nr:hypothetical protein [Microbacterium bovistercoris]
MRLAIADPPYLGRADRWYGDGRGSGRTRTDGGYRGRNGRKPDHHPDAARWDDPAAHRELVERLDAEFDGWAVCGHASTTGLLLAAAPARAQLAIWGRPNAVPGGARVVNTWEPVVVCVPRARRDRSTGLRVRDLLVAPVRRQGFLGSKPPEWTRWVLDMLGYDPSSDELVDVFAGSGAVAAAADGMLPLVGAQPTEGEQR